MNAAKITGLAILILGAASLSLLRFGNGDTADHAAIPPALVVEQGTDASCNDTDASMSERISYAPAETIGTLDCPQVRESSGLGSSRATPSLLWTHNDSGDRPHLYAFDFKGMHLATVSIEGAACVDWEDMATFSWKGQPYIVVADIGDNQSRRETCQLYLVPDTVRQGDSFAEKLRVDRTISFTYEDGPHDCESIGYDHESGAFILVSKSWSAYCDAYQLAIPDEGDDTVQIAKKIARLKLAGFTGFDISPDSTRAIGVTYADAYEFTRATGESWGDALQREPRSISLPPRRQGEGICYGPDGITIFTSSEHFQPPLIRVSPR